MDEVIKYFNGIYPTIKFTSKRSTTSIPFLDIKIQLHNDKIDSDLYCKPTHKQQYLQYSSSHTYHTKKSIPYSLALPLHRICSTDNFFERRCSAKRVYKEHLKKKRKLQERNKISRTKALKEHKQAIKDKSKQVLFTVTNNPALPNIQDIPRKKQPILYSTERLKTKSTKKYLLSLSVAHLIFVTYSFVKKNSRTPAIYQRPPL